MELEDIKLYLKIDGEYEDVLLIALQATAEEYLLGAGINKDYDKKTYKLAVLMLISNWYTNRSVIGENGKASIEIPFGVRALIQQLQFTVAKEVTK